MKQTAWPLLKELSVLAQQITWRYLHKCNCHVTQLSVYISAQCSPNSTVLSEGSHPSPACPSANSSVKIQLSMQHWLNDIDRKNMSSGRETVTVPLCPPQAWIWHGLTPNRPEPGQVKLDDVTWRDAARSIQGAKSANNGCLLPEAHVEHENSLRVQDAESLFVISRGIYSYQHL